MARRSAPNSDSGTADQCCVTFYGVQGPAFSGGQRFQRKPSLSSLGPQQQQQQQPGGHSQAGLQADNNGKEQQQRPPLGATANGQPPSKKQKSGLVVKFGSKG